MRQPSLSLAATAVALLALHVPTLSGAFAPISHHRQAAAVIVHATSGNGEADTSTSRSAATRSGTDKKVTAEHDETWQQFAAATTISTPKLSIRAPLPDERGKGGVYAAEPISALEIVGRIPRSLIITARDAPKRAVLAAAEASNISWLTELTAAALVALHPAVDSDSDSDQSSVDDNKKAAMDVISAKQSWVQSWQDGGWATNSADLGPPDAQFGPKCVTGSLVSTGSDNDHNIYAKFRFPCHPVIHRAGIGLAFLTGAEEDECREALVRRGKTYRSMRDALLGLVAVPSERKGSMRERRAWDVADAMSRVLSRVTTVQLPDLEDGRSGGSGEVPTPAIVPLHERLGHCTDERGENVKVISSDDGGEILLLATRDIEKGEEIVRDYNAAPRIDGDATNGALRLLLQFGLPPSAWPSSMQ